MEKAVEKLPHLSNPCANALTPIPAADVWVPASQEKKLAILATGKWLKNESASWVPAPSLVCLLNLWKKASRLPLGHQSGDLVEQFRPIQLPAVGAEMHRRAVPHQLCGFPDTQPQIHPQAQCEGMAQAIGH